MGAETYLKEINNKNKDPLLSKYINYVIHTLSSRVKSREEMLDEILIQQQQNIVDDKSAQNKDFYVSPSPRHFFNVAKPLPTTPQTTPRKKLEFSTPSTRTVTNLGHSSSAQTEKSATLKQELVNESDEPIGTQ